MNLAALKTELLAGHPDTGPYNADDTLAAGELNAVNRTWLVVIPSEELLVWAAGGSDDLATPPVLSRYERVELASTRKPPFDSLPGSAVGAAKAVMKMFDMGLDLHLNKPGRTAMLTGLVAAGIFTTAESDELVALATQNISRAVELGLGTIEEEHVRHARTL